MAKLHGKQIQEKTIGLGHMSGDGIATFSSVAEMYYDKTISPTDDDKILVNKEYVDLVAGSASGGTMSMFYGEVSGNIEVGGIDVDINFSAGKTMQEMWYMLLYPELFGDFTNPNLSFTILPNNLQEIGNEIDLTFKAIFNQGKIDPQYQSASDKRSGLPNTYTYVGYGIAGSTPKTSLSDTKSIVGYTVLDGKQEWELTVNYDAGVQPKSNKGNDYDSPLSAGSINKKVSFNGVYPIYGTINDIDTSDKINLVEKNSTFNIDLVEDRVDNTVKKSFDIPDGWNNVTTIFEFNPVSSNYDINVDLLNFDISTEVHDVNLNEQNIAYKRYTLIGPKKGATKYKISF